MTYPDLALMPANVGLATRPPQGTLGSFFSNLLVIECLRIIILLFYKAHFYTENEENIIIFQYYFKKFRKY